MKNLLPSLGLKKANEQLTTLGSLPVGPKEGIRPTEGETSRPGAPPGGPPEEVWVDMATEEVVGEMSSTLTPEQELPGSPN